MAHTSVYDYNINIFFHEIAKQYINFKSVKELIEFIVTLFFENLLQFYVIVNKIFNCIFFLTNFYFFIQLEMCTCKCN